MTTCGRSAAPARRHLYSQYLLVHQIRQAASNVAAKIGWVCEGLNADLTAGA
jgi:hypothetical protein